MTREEGTIAIEGIGQVRLYLHPTEEELVQAERAKRARGFFLALIESLLIEPSFVREDWVRLPEEALRPLALTIAEANGLLPFFRPKRKTVLQRVPQRVADEEVEPQRGYLPAGDRDVEVIFGKGAFRGCGCIQKRSGRQE